MSAPLYGKAPNTEARVAKLVADGVGIQLRIEFRPETVDPYSPDGLMPAHYLVSGKLDNMRYGQTVIEDAVKHAAIDILDLVAERVVNKLLDPRNG